MLSAAEVIHSEAVKQLTKIGLFYFKMSALNLTVKVHPLVLFQVVDAFERRNADSQRVIGTLLGNYFIQTIGFVHF